MQLGFSVDGYGVGDSVAASRPRRPSVDALVAEYASLRARGRASPGGARRDSLDAAARIEAGLRAFLDEHGSHAFTDTFEDLHGLPQLPGIAAQRLMADGYGFGAEGDWKAAALVRILKVMASGLPGGTSFMEDYTYDLAPVARWCSGRTCSRSAPRSRRPGRRARSTRSRSAEGRPCAARVRRCPGPGGPRQPRRSRRPIPAASRTRSTSSLRPRAAEASGRSGSLAASARFHDRGRGVAPCRRLASLRLHRGARARSDRDLAEIAGVELVTIGAETRLRDVSAELHG